MKSIITTIPTRLSGNKTGGAPKLQNKNYKESLGFRPK